MSVLRQSIQSRRRANADLRRGERQTIAHFELMDQIGVGAFGSVWMARDTHLDRVVAVKIPRKGQLDATETEQFVREARAAAQLRHPNIVAVHEVDDRTEDLYRQRLCRGIDVSGLADWSTAYVGARQRSFASLLQKRYTTRIQPVLFIVT